MKLLIIGGSRSLAWANKIGYLNQFLKINAVPCVAKPEPELTVMDKSKGLISLQAVVRNNEFTHVLAIGKLGVEQASSLGLEVFCLSGKRSRAALLEFVKYVGEKRASNKKR